METAIIGCERIYNFCVQTVILKRLHLRGKIGEMGEDRLIGGNDILMEKHSNFAGIPKWPMGASL